MKDGVMYVYQDADHLVKEKPIEFPYTDLETFLDDQNMMYAFISDGPLWVIEGYVYLCVNSAEVLLTKTADIL